MEEGGPSRDGGTARGGPGARPASAAGGGSPPRWRLRGGKPTEEGGRLRRGGAISAGRAPEAALPRPRRARPGGSTPRKLAGLATTWSGGHQALHVLARVEWSGAERSVTSTRDNTQVSRRPPRARRGCHAGGGPGQGGCNGGAQRPAPGGLPGGLPRAQPGGGGEAPSAAAPSAASAAAPRASASGIGDNSGTPAPQSRPGR